MKNYKLILVIIVGLFVLSGCAGSEVLSWREPNRTLEIMDRTEVYADDVAHGGRVYKGLYSRAYPYNQKNVQYKVISAKESRYRLSPDLTIPMGKKILLITGAFTVLHQTGPAEIVDSFGMHSSNPGQFTDMKYLNPHLIIKMTIHQRGSEAVKVMEGKYRYRDMGPHKFGSLLALPVIGDNGNGIDFMGTGKGGINVQIHPKIWQEIRVEYHDPDNRAGSFIKAWEYTVNK